MIVVLQLKVLLSKWMKELEKNFYGAVAAYDMAMRPEAAQDELARALWRYVPFECLIYVSVRMAVPLGSTFASVHTHTHTYILLCPP